MSGKILVTGANGLLGYNLLSFLSLKNIVGVGSEFDITVPEIINAKLDEEEPDIIIHTAAYTDVDGCEVNPDKAYKVNTIGTQNLVNYCVGKDILFIYISSTGIYGQDKLQRYTEFDSVNPTTIHHKSKYEAEKIVQNHISKYLILRTGWLYGDEKISKKNFVKNRILEAKSSNEIYSDDTQIGNPTSAFDLVQQIELLIKNKHLGIFNCVNEALNVSRYEYVKNIIELLKIECSVKIAQAGAFNRVAQVSRNESALNYKLDLLGINVMGNWKESLSSYIHRADENYE